MQAIRAPLRYFLIHIFLSVFFIQMIHWNFINRGKCNGMCARKRIGLDVFNDDTCPLQKRFKDVC